MSSYLDPHSSRKSPASANPPAEAKEEQIRVDGFGQVIQMLQVADDAFRESLLKRLQTRDPELARNLRAYLARL